MLKMENFVIVSADLSLAESSLALALRGSENRVFRCSVSVEGGLAILSKILGVTYLSAIPGTSVRGIIEDGKIANIGNIVDEVWLLPIASEEAENLTKDKTTEP